MVSTRPLTPLTETKPADHTRNRAQTPAPKLIGRRYRLLLEIGAGGMGVVYSALDRLTGQRVALKRVTTAPTELIFATLDATRASPRLALANEFKTLATLRHPNIISVLDYGFDSQRQPFFTMDLIEGAHTLTSAARNLNTTAQIRLVIQALQALAYLHRRGILHRDLKPANILVKNDQVKVLDFGLSIARATVGGHDTSGTLAYLAPEVLQGNPASEASDLYALGMIAYEIFSGAYPFDLTSPSNLLKQIIDQTPPLDRLQVNAPTVQVIERLIAKNPADRYGSAQEVIQALQGASSIPLAAETTETRESYLQAADFIGRNAELEALMHALSEAQDGRGAAWLIGGESGVGKTRLIEELRARALIAGAVVLRGGASSNGQASYQVWREVLRRLVLLTELSDLEASTLKVIVPDIGGLLERAIPDALELDPQAVQTRLLSTVTDILRRVDVPLVIILEDLHWAGDESLTLLSAVIRVCSTLPILLVGNYRDDERPDLPAKLPPVERMELKRLTPESVADLSESILGASGRDPSIVRLLHRETEGNVFFLVEVVRALAEALGGLEQVGQATLPKNILTGGIKTIIERRLTRVPAEIRPMLAAAAIFGRRLDLAVLGSAVGKENVEKWLQALADLQIVNVQDDRWQFAHDKLRESLLDGLTAEQQKPIHRQVAESIEQVYPGSPDQYAALAFHWSLAGDAPKTEHYSDLAGEQSLNNGAYQEAITLLGRANTLSTDTAPVRAARRERLIAQGYLGLGRLPETDRHLKIAAAKLGAATPAGGTRLFFALLNQIGRQALHRLIKPRIVPIAQQPHILETADLYEQLALRYYWDNQKFPAFHAAVTMLNYAERIPPTRERVRAYANTVVAAGVVPAHSIARTYARLARETGEQINHPPSLATALRLIQVYYVGVGDWTSEQNTYDEALAIAGRFGDYRVLGDTKAIHMVRQRYRGEFAGARQTAEAVFELGERTGSIQLKSWASGTLGVVELYQDRAADAEKRLNYLRAQYGGQIDEGQELEYVGILGLSLYRQGRIAEAEKIAERSLELIIKTAPVVSTALEGYASCADVYLQQWEKTGEAGYREKAEQAIKAAFRFARIFKVGKPRALLLRGRAEHLAGEADKAQKSWAEALVQAKTLHDPLEVALITYHASRALPTTNPAREPGLTSALDQFELIGASYYVRLIEQT